MSSRILGVARTCIQTQTCTYLTHVPLNDVQNNAQTHTQTHIPIHAHTSGESKYGEKCARYSTFLEMYTEINEDTGIVAG